jgi:hypothetical protein
MNRGLVYILCLAILLPGICFGHGGRLDINGGHNNRKTGKYHYHKQTSGTPTPTSKPNRTVSPKNEIKTSTEVPLSPPTAAERSRKIAEYFRVSNENVGALSSDIVIHMRDVESVKEYVKRRDGYHCVICGSTTKLEVDHRRALMNGGSNDIINLATLCDDCHTEKTRMDSSLRRKRESLAGK